jgi:hypothetical protein
MAAVSWERVERAELNNITEISGIVKRRTGVVNASGWRFAGVHLTC